MLIVLDGGVRHKAFHDPKSQTIDVWAASAQPEGTALAIGEALTIVVDDEGAFSHLCLQYGGLPMESALPNRPADCPMAVSADVEVGDADASQFLLDSTEGTLRLSLGGRSSQQWARLGENLIWLGIDGDGGLGAMIIEGISRDPGGKAQSAWLAQMGIG